MRAPRTDLPWGAVPATHPATTQIAAALGVAPITAHLLAMRGATTPAAAQGFLYPHTQHTHNALQMKGMHAVATRVYQAVANRERITIYGDYDADGIPGTALLASFLRKQGAKVSTYIPPREEGYGLSVEAAKRIERDQQPQVVITIDCGSSDHDAIRYLQGRGIEVIVTDHHLTLKGPPPTPYFINPNRSDGETYPFTGLCGCGVAYKLVTALTQRDEPALFDLLALSTVCDQVPLIDENRYYVKAALEQINALAQANVGMRAIVETCGRHVSLRSLTPIDIGWKIGPRINAVGRMGADPNMVVELLTTSDHGKATQLAVQINKLNASRKGMTEELTERALSQIGSRPDDVIVAYLPDATVGVAGLVAAKITETYQRPSLVVNSEGRGSGRAPRGLEIMPYMEQLRAAGVFGRARKVNGVEIMPDFGGHAGACGFHNVDVKALQSAAKRLRLPRGYRPEVTVDGQISFADINETTATHLDMLEPFGIGNPEPTLLLAGVNVVRQSAMTSRLVLEISDGSRGTRNVRATWRGGGSLAGSVPKRVDLLGRPTISAWSGQLEFEIGALRPAK